MRAIRGLLAVLFAAAIAATATAPVSAQPSISPDEQADAADAVVDQLDASDQPLDLDQIDQLDQLGPNPWLSYTSNRSPEAVKAWQRVAAQLPERAQIPKGKPTIGKSMTFAESEAPGETGANDTVATGELIDKFGTGPGDRGVVTISGSLSGGVVRNPIQGDCESTEDDGSIPQANPTPAAEIYVALCVGVIGDGPFGDTTGDVDFYSYGVVEEGSVLILDTWHISDTIDPVRSVIGIYDADGNLLDTIEDGGLPGDDPILVVTAPATGEYFAAIAGCCDLSTDPFDSASGPGVGDTGTYELLVVAFPPPCISNEDDGSIALANDTYVPDFGSDFCTGTIGDGPYGNADTDFYSLGTVEAGKVLVADVSAFDTPVRTVVGIYDAAGNLIASGQDSGDYETGDYLEATAPTTGEYFVAVAGCCELPTDANDPASGTPSDQSGPYELFIGAFDPPCRSTEDDGSIGLANDTYVPDYQFDYCTGEIGDGPHGNADTDFYSLGPIAAGDLLYVDTYLDGGAGSMVIGVYNSAGDLVASVEDNGPEAIDIEIPADDSYFVVLAGCCGLPADPNDPASGAGSDQTGSYEVIFEVYQPPCESSEDDGAIDQANDTNPWGDPDIYQAVCFGQVGDGPQAGANGDVDFFRTRPLDEGRLLIVDFEDIGGSAGAGELTIGVYNEAGELLATGADDPFQSGPRSDYFSYTVPAAGVYYVAVGGAMPTDPFDPTTGTDTTITSPYNIMWVVDTTAEFVGGGTAAWGERPWGNADFSALRSEAGAAAPRADWSKSSKAQLTALIDARKAAAETEAAAAPADDEPVLDTDVYLVDLQAGDAISGGFDASRVVAIIDPNGVQRSGAPFNPSFIYPIDSPLRHNRRTGFDHVATVDGVHAIVVSDGAGAYEGELRVIRSGLSSKRTNAEQVIYVDFDGASVGGDVFETYVDAELSPLSSFLADWGLSPADEDAVIDATLDAIIESVDTDLRVLDGRNGDRDATDAPTKFDVTVLNSRDNPDVWGQPNVTRLIVGGTIDQLQIPAIGIAQSIDPGNLDTTETAVILLDVMSGPQGDPASINTYPVADGTSKAEFVGFVVGHIAAHEMGHLIGNWHQETFNEIEALMDAGGDFPAIAGVGEDGVFGTADDTDPDFVEDVFNSNEGFSGVEDTAGRSVFALSTGNLPLNGRPGNR